MIQKSKLSVSINDAEFSKDYQYMISASFDKQKVASRIPRNKLMSQLLLNAPFSPIITSSLNSHLLIHFKGSSS